MTCLHGQADDAFPASVRRPVSHGYSAPEPGCSDALFTKLLNFVLRREQNGPARLAEKSQNPAGNDMESRTHPEGLAPCLLYAQKYYTLTLVHKSL